jgi:peptidoglycan/xylan/chitin deacetylase (PgdA/CDA1 family)
VTIDELIKHITGEIKLPGKVAAVTFDGGYAGNYKYAFPILKRYNVPATVYVVTNSIDGNIPWERKLLYLIFLTKKERFKLNYGGKEHEFEIKTHSQKRLTKRIIQDYLRLINQREKDDLLKQISKNLNIELSGLAHKLFLSWDQINEMNKSRLITIGSHTLTHPILTEISLEEARREIGDSKIHIEGKLGEEIETFCYPDGFFNKEIIDLVKDSGYSSALAVTTPQILNDLNKIGDTIFELRRIQLPDSSYIPSLSTQLTGLMQTISKIWK